MIKDLKTYFAQNDYLMVFILWSFFQLIWIRVFGFNFQEESLKYISEADNFSVNHSFSQLRFIFYSFTIFVIVISNFLKIGLHGAVLVIMLINLFSYLYFYKALKSVFTTALPAFLIVVFLFFFWPYQRWSTTLFTECAFYSFVMLLFSRLILFKKINASLLLSVAGILFLIIITRPLGILFVLPVLIFIYSKLSRNQRVLFLVAFLIGGVGFNMVIQIVFTTTSDWSMIQALQSDIIIADKVEIPVNPNVIVSHSSSQLYQLFFYVTHNFPHFIYLAVKRLEAFFFLKRNYYSAAHNIFLTAPVFLMYGIILFKIKILRRKLSSHLLLFILLSVSLFAMTVALQFDDYHNRFFLTCLPFITFLSVAGLYSEQIKNLND